MNATSEKRTQDSGRRGRKGVFLRFVLSPESLFLFCLLIWLPIARAQISSSALIGQAMDAQVSELSAQGGVLDVMKAIENQTGVRLEASPAVWDALPWGQDTSISIHVRNVTVQQALDAFARRLGLVITPGSEAVELDPSPGLARLGRRATLDEIGALDLLSRLPAGLPTTTPTVQQLLDATDGSLLAAKSPYAVQERGLSQSELTATVQVARNATLMDALEEMSRQTPATWYPWGRTLVVTHKIDAVRLLLSRRITRQFDDEELSQVLLDLAEYSHAGFHYAPGALAAAGDRHVNFRLEGATVEEALEFISGKTGLQFTTTDDGVSVTFAGVPTRP
jgi:hypothetical protein